MDILISQYLSGVGHGRGEPTRQTQSVAQSQCTPFICPCRTPEAKAAEEGVLMFGFMPCCTHCPKMAVQHYEGKNYCERCLKVRKGEMAYCPFCNHDGKKAKTKCIACKDYGAIFFTE